MRHCRHLVVLAGIGLAAAGCGTVTAQTASLTTAVTNTTAQTAQIAVTTIVRMQGMSMSFSETGQFDFAHSRGTVSMRSPIGITEIILPPKVYIRVPVGSGTLPHGKSWIAIDNGASAGDSPAGMNVLLGGPGSDGLNPADLLASLTAISGNVTKLGAATVRGVPVTEFRVNVDLAKAAARMPGWERAGFRDFASSLGTGDIPVDVWVDNQNLVRRVQVSLHPTAGTGAPTGTTFAQVTDFYDFGVPVRVSAPPAAQVASTSQFISGSSASASGSGSFNGSTSPPPQGADGVKWLVAAESAGHWYIDLAASSDGFPSGACS